VYQIAYANILRMKRRYLLLLILFWLAILAAILYLTHRQKPANQQQAPIYHGGPCDDQTYYNSHLQTCSVQ
jgi:hypothetical protein